MDIGAYEAKTNLSRLLDEVEGGATITITRNGKPVAKLSPVTDTSAVIASILERRSKMKKGKGKVSIRALINEGRRM